MKCWGSNRQGRLGDGTTTDRNTPVDVVGLTSGVADISTSSNHTCVLTTGGGIKCWGFNHFGQLGDGTTTDRNTPVDVVGLTSGVVAVSTNSRHTCALTTSGGVKCWGQNSLSQVGDGTTTDRNTPVDVVGLSGGVAAISAGYIHSCALTNSGGVKCWGAYRAGLYEEVLTDTLVDVTGLNNGVSAISAGGYFTCVITNAGGVRCWDTNHLRYLRDGTTTDHTPPVDVVGLTGE